MWISSGQKKTGKMCECPRQRVISWLQEKANTQPLWLTHTHRSCFFSSNLCLSPNPVLVNWCTMFSSQTVVLFWNNKQDGDSMPARTKNKSLRIREMSPVIYSSWVTVHCFLHALSKTFEAFSSKRKEEWADDMWDRVIIRLKPAMLQVQIMLQSPIS